MSLKHLPNIVSFFRLLLILPFLYFFYHEAYQAAFYMFIIAGLSDGIDGWLARFLQSQTPMGHIVDPIADKLLIVSSVIALAFIHKLPWWLVLLIFMRDFTISCCVVGVYYFDRKTRFMPSMLSKFNTALQVFLVGVCLFETAFGVMFPVGVPILIGLTACTTTLSYLDYARIGIQHLKCPKTSALS